MGNLYYDYKPEMYQLKKYLGKGKHGGFVFEVATGHMNSEYDIGETSEIMVLLTKDEYDKLGENEQLKAQVANMREALLELKNIICNDVKCPYEYCKTECEYNSVVQKINKALISNLNT